MATTETGVPMGRRETEEMMSINESEYRFNLQGLMQAVRIASDQLGFDCKIVITRDRVTFSSVNGLGDCIYHSPASIAKLLDGLVERFYNE